MKIQLFPDSNAFLSYWGLSHPFWELNLATLRDTWVAMLALAVIIGGIRFCLRRKHHIVGFAVMQGVAFFESLAIESFGRFRYDFFSFITALFIFTFMCNIIGLLPFIEEPTRDLNTALAIGIISFMYIQVQKVIAHGLFAYIQEYLVIFDWKQRWLSIPASVCASLLLLPLTLLGELAKVVSMSFRLFGNILGGSILFMIALVGIQTVQSYYMIYAAVILLLSGILWLSFDVRRYPKVYATLLALLLCVFAITLAQLFVGFFEGLVQAYVVMTLTVTYLAIGTEKTTGSEKQS